MICRFNFCGRRFGKVGDVVDSALVMLGCCFVAAAGAIGGLLAVQQWPLPALVLITVVPILTVVIWVFHDARMEERRKGECS